MKALENVFDSIRPNFVGDGKLKLLWPMFEGAETFFLTPGEKTHQGAHVRDPMDLKRLMIFVDFALLPCILFGCWNAGYHAFLYEGLAGAEGGIFGAVGHLDYVLRGAWQFLPIYMVTVMVGGMWEMLFCIVRKHEINEGFLVTSMLFPLTLPPTIPLWMVAMGISFGVVIGKEVFGGVGMNILNPALTARAFVFFTYPAHISGAVNADGYGVWDAAGAWAPTAWVSGEGIAAGATPEAFVDGYTGATPLLAVANAEPGTGALAALHEAGWTWNDLFFGFVPGSMGETSALAVLIGAVFLIGTGIASWRIMAGGVLGLLAMGSAIFFLLGGGMGSEAISEVPMTSLPPWYHLVAGSFAFGIVFMATDPVSAAITPLGRWIYGALIGALVVLVRVANPAYPEGVMLAILFMNVFAPLIDHFIVKSTTRRRAARLAVAA
ncbi:MAG: NADH:ubiquinone reductase (Na(+)-transporting) subunit B [Deltaproteobacteria bacterium]|nr:MAG: NADH:ubiquinone reductase (Na(+)-transporting) subunit B [Deltaproteobacteria bacterium]